jgi:hypothetical protein
MHKQHLTPPLSLLRQHNIQLYLRRRLLECRSRSRPSLPLAPQSHRLGTALPALHPGHLEAIWWCSRYGVRLCGTVRSAENP